MRYSSDLTDDQWELVKNLIPVGCNTKIDRRELMNVVFYIVKTVYQWR
jgi:transposase